MTIATDEPPLIELPPEPIHRLTRPFERYLHVEASSGIVLLLATAVALVLANSPLADAFAAIWKTEVAFGFGTWEMRHSLKHWISDGLMGVFFFVIGLEVKREFVLGELRTWRQVALPVFSALGGMLAPATIYLLLQPGGDAARGWGIPMATDIAFVVGCMAVLGPRVPHAFRIWLLSLAIADDIGAILVIAIGYTAELHVAPLALAIAATLAVSLLQRLGVRAIFLYVVLGTLVWFGLHESGLHATLAGVILGLQTPAHPYLERRALGRALHRLGEHFRGSEDEDEDEEHKGAHANQGTAPTQGPIDLRTRSNAAPLAPDPHAVKQLRYAARESVSPLDYLIELLHPWQSFAIIPLFALANAGVPLRLEDCIHPVSLAIAAGLALGKPLGIFVFAELAVRLGLATYSEGMSKKAILGGGCLAGIGFTMALFVDGLAFASPLQETAKVGILIGSFVSAILGLAVLARAVPTPAPVARSPKRATAEGIRGAP
jgi:NhaA family Na+:H+ antiporter